MHTVHCSAVQRIADITPGILYTFLGVLVSQAAVLIAAEVESD